MIQCYIKKCSDLDEKVNRRNILPTLKTAEVAVADIQADGQLFLRQVAFSAQLSCFCPFVFNGGRRAERKKRSASLITEKNLYVIGQEEKRQGYNAGIDK